MSAVLTEIADDPRQVCLHHQMIRVSGPEALRVKILERPTREFDLALAFFWSLLRRVHDIKISSLAGGEQVAIHSPSFLNRLFTSLKWKSSEQSFSSSRCLKYFAMTILVLAFHNARPCAFDAAVVAREFRKFRGRRIGADGFAGRVEIQAADLFGWKFCDQ